MNVWALVYKHAETQVRKMWKWETRARESNQVSRAETAMNSTTGRRESMSAVPWKCECPRDGETLPEKARTTVGGREGTVAANGPRVRLGNVGGSGLH